MSFSMFTKSMSGRFLYGLLGLLVAALLCPANSSAQAWTWSVDQIDTQGEASSLAADNQGNLHVSYRSSAQGELRYAFWDHTRWYKMTLDQGLNNFFSRIAVDRDGNPAICYTPQMLKFVRFDGRRWSKPQQVDPEGGLFSYYCSLGFGKDGQPRIAWYVESGVWIRYAALQDGVWVAQTVDREGMPGKWNSLVVDKNGLPHLSYGTIFSWELKYALYDGKKWTRTSIDSPQMRPPAGERGMGNSLVLDAAGNPLISYYDMDSLRLARVRDNKWTTEVVEHLPNFGPNWSWRFFRSTILLDSKGAPHIVFESLLGLEHAWWNGSQWSSQVIVPSLGTSVFDNSAAIGPDDTLYIVFTNPLDRTLRVATGKAIQGQTAQAGQKESTKN